MHALRQRVAGAAGAAAALGIVVVLAMLAASCRVPVEQVTMAPSRPLGAASAEVLPVVGPVPGSSHWHAAYIVRICDDVLDPFDTDADPLGIHSHGDGVMHVHPFVEESGYENATLGLFADAMGFGLADGELLLPGGGAWRDGDLCNGVPGRVFVDRWAGPDADSEVVRHFDGLADLRYLADAELYQIAFAPVDSFPVVPPASELLPELSNLEPAPDPWVDVDPSAPSSSVEFWQIGEVGTEPCADDAVTERVLDGPSRCFTPTGDRLAAADVVDSARAVVFNRRPAVEIRMDAALVELFERHFAQTSDPFALAIAADGFVVSAPQLARPPVGDRLVVSGGFSVETARQLAVLLDP